MGLYIIPSCFWKDNSAVPITAVFRASLFMPISSRLWRPETVCTRGIPWPDIRGISITPLGRLAPVERSRRRNYTEDSAPQGRDLQSSLECTSIR